MEKELFELIAQDQMKRNVEVLGLERVEELIESLKQPVYRAVLRRILTGTTKRGV